MNPKLDYYTEQAQNLRDALVRLAALADTADKLLAEARQQEQLRDEFYRAYQRAERDGQRDQAAALRTRYSEANLAYDTALAHLEAFNPLLADLAADGWEAHGLIERATAA